MIKKLLIANRGEIACRIIKTAKRLGIKTLAIYSDIDCNARFVKLSDESVALDGIDAAQTYLNIDKIINIAIESPPATTPTAAPEFELRIPRDMPKPD